MKLSYKYRILPSEDQKLQLDKTFEFCRILYNAALQERIAYYKKFGKGTTYNLQTAQLPEIKISHEEECSSIYSQILQQVLKRLDRSFQNFFRRHKMKAAKVGFPRYKSFNSFSSITFPQCDMKVGGVRLKDNGKLKIFGITGDVNIILHRPFQGRCKTVTIKKKSNKYYIVASCSEVPMELLPKTGKIVAIDLGLTSFITTDDGTKFHHPKPYKTSKELLAYRSRKLAKKQKGSKNREKAKNLVTKIYEKITNIRLDFLHKTAKQLIAENDIIIIEKLNIAAMMEAKGFQVNVANIADASWGGFATILKYKAERAGRLIIEVDPRNTSKMCSCCGTIKDNLTLRDREYHCIACGNAMDRDQNAAKNIKRLGLGLSLASNLTI